MQIPEKIKEILDKLRNAGFEAYPVGGCVRDLILEREIRDWDVTTNALPEQIQKVFPETFYENSFGTVSVVNEMEIPSLKVVEITPYRTEGRYSDKRHPDEVKFAKKLEDDLSRRDFTINALALSEAEGSDKIIDFFDGQKDLKNKIIKTVGDPEKRFSEDALRLMRAVRFATELNFNIEENTQRAIRKMAGLLREISQERIRDEFSKIIMANDAAFGVWLLNDLGLLQYIIPELCEGVGVIGVTKKLKSHIKYEQLSIFDHNVKTLEYAAKNGFNFETRLAALLHDLGKSRTKVGEGLDANFKGHEQVGAKMAWQVLNRLHFSKKVIEKATLLVRWHFFFYDAEEVTEAGVRRLIKRVGADNIKDLLLLRQADRSGSGIPKISSYRLRHLEYMIERVSKDPISAKMLKIDGIRLMELLKIEPGPKVGAILDVLLSEVIDDPGKNQFDYLEKKAKELIGQDLDVLRSLAKDKIEEKKEQDDLKIKGKYSIK